ncbi:electron transport complex protein [Citrobacter freundii]|nr:electron transport complex protein [Citrobacter freundii]
MVFRIASSPYTHNQRQTSRIMMLVLLAALPGIAAQLWFFGWGTLFQIVLAAISAIAAEAGVLKLRKQPIVPILKDNSALLTGLLLAVSIPPLAPWWMVVLGTVFAVIIAKQLYGGLGQNPFNPAMIGYVVLLISFPVQMTSWLPPHEIAATVPGFFDALNVILSGHTVSGGDMNTLRMGIDGISQATPLDTFKTSLHAGHTVEQVMQYPIYSGVLAGAGWQWVNLAWLAGGIVLLWQGRFAGISRLASCCRSQFAPLWDGCSHLSHSRLLSYTCFPAQPCWVHFLFLPTPLRPRQLTAAA